MSSEIVSTIVVPAYKEKPNIRPLTQRLVDALRSSGMDKSTEILIVDDNSQDGSEEAVNELQKEGFPIRIYIRKTERGLSSAVLRGFQEAKGEKLICMDGDLQHPPEKVPQLLKALDKADFVLGTRYGDGFAVDPSWPWYRVVISKGARLLARPLTPLSDPMSGFFGITKSALKRGGGKINPVGFKIALELYVKCGSSSHEEVSIFFGKREAGTSKLTGKVMLYYLLHLFQLYRYQYPMLLPALLVLVLAVMWLLVSTCLGWSSNKAKLS